MVSAPVKSPEPVRWLESVVEQAQSASGKNPLEVTLPGGARVELTETKQLPLTIRAGAG